MPNETVLTNGLQSARFRIEGGGCSCEGQIIEKRVRALKGVKSLRLNPITNQMNLTYDPAAVTLQEIAAAVKKTGAKPILLVSR